MDEINGTLVASLTLAADHAVRFYDFGNGAIAIRESSSLEEPDAGALVRVDLEVKMASQIYQSLSGEKGDSAAVPLALREAERLAPASRGALESMDPGGLDPSILVPNVPIPLCSADAYNGDYGANWFLDRYCAEGGFRHCPTNSATSEGFADDRRPLTMAGMPWLFAGEEGQSSWFKACAMAADFQVSSKFFGGRIEQSGSGAASIQKDYDLEVRPRHVECWAYTGVGKRWSVAGRVDDCSRTHFSAMRHH